jgi:hypothetical protein
MLTALVSALTCSCLLVPSSAAGADFQVISVESGHNTDVYFEINVSGKVYLAIYAPPGGDACANFWWIKFPLGSIKDLGRHCGTVSLEIPGLAELTLSAKLRVGTAKQPLKIIAAANEKVARSVTVHF